MTSRRALKTLYLLTTGGVLFFCFREWRYDDPYITYRYAANLAEGIGFVYNPGARLLSTTSPLLAVLLAGLRLIGADIPTAAQWIGALSLAFGGLLFYEIAVELDRPAAAAALAALYPGASMLVSTLGSETPLYLALSLGGAWCYIRRRYAGAGILLGLAALARADALVLAGVLALDWLVRTAREQRSFRALAGAVPITGVLAFLGILIPWFLFSAVYFGSPLPDTLAAKQAQGVFSPETLFLPGLWDLATRLVALPHYWILAALVLAGIWRAISSREPGWGPILLWPLFFTAGYTFLGVTRYPWYYASLVPGVFAAAGLGFNALLAAASNAPSRNWMRTAALVLVIAFFAGQISDLDRLRTIPDTRYTIYREVGLWLSENTAPEDSIGTLEVGIIGYFARPRPMIDFTGLLQPDIAEIIRESENYSEVAFLAAERYRPDYLVLTPGYRHLQADYIPDHCTLATHFPGADYGYDRDISVYACD